MRKMFNVKVDVSFPQFQAATFQEVGGALNAIGEQVMTLAKQEYVPVVTGNLRRSGFVEPPKITANKVQTKIGFGGSAAWYALEVHEYPASVGQGKNKYLQKAIQAFAPQIEPEFIRHLTSFLSRRRIP